MRCSQTHHWFVKALLLALFLGLPLPVLAQSTRDAAMQGGKFYKLNRPMEGATGMKSFGNSKFYTLSNAKVSGTPVRVAKVRPTGAAAEPGAIADAPQISFGKPHLVIAKPKPVREATPPAPVPVAEQEVAALMPTPAALPPEAKPIQPFARRAPIADVQVDDLEDDFSEHELPKIKAISEFAKSVAEEDERSPDLQLAHAWPVETNVSTRISSKFGWRSDPVHGKRAFHSGVDFAAATGTAVLASAAGTVSSVGAHPRLGKFVRIKHRDGSVSVYGHLSATSVGEGKLVVQGQEVGEIGSTGRSTGPHLHYALFVDGKPVDPMPRMRKNLPTANVASNSKSIVK